MKKHIFWQNLMIIIAGALLLLSFVPGTVTQNTVLEDGAVAAEKYSVFTLQSSDTPTAFPMFIQTVLLCIGAFAFRVTGSEKTLGWTIVASALGVAIYALTFFSQNELHISIFVLILLVTELILSIGYKIGRHMGLLI